MARPLRLAYLVSHPIQYQAPLLRCIAAQPDLDLTVLFGSDFSLRHYQDKGFGVDVAWDVPLVEGYCHEFPPRLRDRGDVGVFAPLNRGLLKRLSRGSGGRPFDALWVHGYATANALQGMLAAKALGLPVLLRADSWLKDRRRSPLRLAAKRVFFSGLRGLVDAVLPTGTYNAEYWAHYFGEDVPQFLMPYAVDNAYFRQRALDAAPRRADLLRLLHMEPDRGVILFASKLQKRKRCMDLLQAYERFCRSGEKRDAPPPYLVIVGDGEERGALEAFVKDRQLEEVRFCGFRNQSELPRFFEMASLFVLPSEHEPWGLIVNEAMSCGCPVIVSDDVGAQPDLVTDGVEGFVYRTGDVAALSHALQRFFADPEKAARMGADARRRIRGWDFNADIDALRAALAVVTRGRAA